MLAADLLSDAIAMNAAPSTHRSTSKEAAFATAAFSTAMHPVTRLVATLSMTVQNGQLVARPLLLTAPAAS